MRCESERLLLLGDCMEEKSLGAFFGQSGRATYECPDCGRSAPYDVERMIGKGSFTCPSCRVDTDNPPLLERVGEVQQ